MASFQKRGKTWQYTISRMVNGKSKPIRKGGFKTKKEAQIAASEMELELQKGVTPKLKPISLILRIGIGCLSLMLLIVRRLIMFIL